MSFRRSTINLNSISDKDHEELTLFQEMRKRERERDPPKAAARSLINNTDPADIRRSSARYIPEGSLIPEFKNRMSATSTVDPDDIFASDCDKTDYDWLMTPPGTPLVPLQERASASNCSVTSTSVSSVRSALKLFKIGTSKSEKSSSIKSDHSSRLSRGSLRQSINVRSSVSCTPSSVSQKTSGTAGSSAGLSNSISATGMASPAAVTRTLSKLTSTPRSSPMSAAKSLPGTRTASSNENMSSGVSSSLSSISDSCPASVSTPISVASLSSISRSSNATGTREMKASQSPSSSGRSSIPVNRGAGSANHPSRPSPLSKRSSSPSQPINLPTALARCSSANDASFRSSRNVLTASFSSPSSKAAGSNIPEPSTKLRSVASERSSFEARANLARTSIAVGSPDSSSKTRKHPSSPTLAKIGASFNLGSGGKTPTHNQKASDRIFGGKGSKIWERSLPRKPKPVAEVEHPSPKNSNIKKPLKSSSRSSVNSSINTEIASRDKDVSKSAAFGFRSFLSNVSLSSLHSIRTVNSAIHQSCSIADSPMATSSNASSSTIIDPEGSEFGDESLSEKGSRCSIASHCDHPFSAAKERRINTWLGSPDCCRDEDVEIMQIFQQEGLDSLSRPESPLVNELDQFDKCCLDPLI